MKRITAICYSDDMLVIGPRLEVWAFIIILEQENQVQIGVTVCQQV